MAELLRTNRLIWGAIAVVITIVGALSLASSGRHLAAVHAVEHTLAVKAAIDGTLSLLKDAETGQRGFILTADPPFLEPYDAALRELPASMERLVAVTHDDPTQRAAWRRLRHLIDDKLAFMRDTIRAQQAGDAPRALARVRSGRGKQIMDQIRSACASMLSHEEELLAARKREAKVSERAATLAVSSGALAAVLLALFAFWTVQRDARELRQAAEELAKSEEHFRLLTEQGSDLVRLLSLEGATTYVSPSVERLLGFDVAEYLALPPRSLLHPDELGLAGQMLAEVRGGQRSEGVATYRMRHKSGEYRWFEVRWAARRDAQGKPLELHTAARDVTERVEAERQLNAYAEQLRSLSVRDELTGLYNRRGFMEAAERVYSQARRERRTAALIFVDLNDMKRINDQQGHEVGDQALVDAAHVLSTTLREGDVVARLGGDEFVAFTLDFGPPELEALRVRLRERADRRVSERKRTFRLSMSVGAAHVTSDAAAPALGALLDQADSAMYEHKTARRAAGGVSVRPPAA